MKTARLSEIKKELQHLSASEIVDICLRLAKYKNDNKELIAYLLFESHNVDAYITDVKKFIQEAYKDVNISNLYIAKKMLRKILKQANKYIKYTGSKLVEVEVLIYYCTLIKDSEIPVHKSKPLNNLYQQQIKKLKLAINLLHEDFQYEFNKQLGEL